jgi:hypothetical protein
VHPNDPLYSQQWYLTKLGNIEKIWDEYSGAGVHIGFAAARLPARAASPHRTA